MAGTITGTLTRLPVRLGSAPMIEIVLACIADADVNTFPAEVITSLAGISDYDLRGLKLYSAKFIPDLVTPPTDKFKLRLDIHEIAPNCRAHLGRLMECRRIGVI